MSGPQLPDQAAEFGDGQDVPLASAGHIPPVTDLVMNEGDHALQKIALLLSLFKGTRHIGYLKLAQNIGKVLKEHPAGQGKRTYEHVILQNLICGKGSFDLSDAKGASQACKKLWFSGPHIAHSSTTSMQPKHLLQLARGLRAGAMGSTVIPERLYRPFVMRFCEEATNGKREVDGAEDHEADVDGGEYGKSQDDESDDNESGDDDNGSDNEGSDDDGSECSEELVNMIWTAYHRVVDMLGSSVAPPSPETMEDPSTSAHSLLLLLEGQKDRIQLIREAIDIEMKAELRGLGLASRTDLSKIVLDYQSCIKRLGEAKDFHQFKDALDRYGLLSTMRAHRLTWAVDGHLAKEISYLSGISAELAELAELQDGVD